MAETMRRLDRQMSQAETEDLLRACHYGVLSMNNTDGCPYGVPLSYIYTDGRIYLHCAPEGKKLAHIRHDDKVSFCVVGEAEPLPDKFSMRYTSAIVFGTVSEVDEHREKEKALVALIDKYGTTDEYREKGRVYAAESLRTTVVLRLDIDHLTGKAGK
ncbi:MAG: pyridoxamine 5'-phosphate oxidase family protein [Peptococcaceae bacterium]|jgi:nitroimidazol reductase NimA-like FMN-containing flavoprotein (pyridoxamine 5'-phosphate oxidase superfamily)|nr:pyridoxamine 5'-phosphate oxidase family protein [Peptococcaceae bacterium]